MIVAMLVGAGFLFLLTVVVGEIVDHEEDHYAAKALATFMMLLACMKAGEWVIKAVEGMTR